MSNSSKLANFQNIPLELQQLPHWVEWSFKAVPASKPTKVPHGSVNDPSTWVSFSEAVKAVATGKADGIGFVFSDQSPYAGIDLDQTDDPEIIKRQQAIFTAFNSYSEISPSGQGLHVIVKGKVKSGRRRECVEVYSSLRYFTFTGNVYDGKSVIEDRQELLEALWVELGGSTTINTATINSSTINESEQHKDQEIIQQALLAENGEKFAILNDGKWQNLYPSQSEADLSFINIIGFYTKNRVQIARIFRASPLGQRPKAKRDVYVSKMIDYAFDKQLPFINIDAVPSMESIRSVVQSAERKPLTLDVVGSNPTGPTTFPKGLLGEIAQFIYDASPRPVPEIALSAAIGLMAGICGRAYNISGTGVNIYTLLLAPTGTGKEGGASGISKLMEEVRKEVPSAMEFMGPSEIASGQALFRYMCKKSQSFVSILGEFGLRLTKISNPNAQSHDISLRIKLLDLYNKSGFTDIIHPSIYADSDKDLPSIQSPAFSICGESTPDTFFDNLNEDMISEGLLPRFIIMEYAGKRVDLNDNHDKIKPDRYLIERLVAITVNALSVNNATPRRVILVGMSSEAKTIDTRFDKYSTDKINGADKSIIRHLWNRSHLNVRKLASLYAIGINPYNPTIEIEQLNWAIDFVIKSIELISKKFETGDIGANSGELRQYECLEKTIKDYIANGFEKAYPYMASNKKAKAFYDKGIIPYDYLCVKLLPLVAFRNDKRGATDALKRCLQVMTNKDVLQEIPKHQVYNEFGVRQQAFKIT